MRRAPLEVGDRGGLGLGDALLARARGHVGAVYLGLRGGRGGRGESAALKDLGAHPVDGGAVKVLSGRYGPYIKHGAINANVPKGSDPLEMTLEEAVKLLAEREAKGGGKKKPARAKAAAKPKAAPKAKAEAKPKAEKKPAAKKAPAKKPKA